MQWTCHSFTIKLSLSHPRSRREHRRVGEKATRSMGGTQAALYYLLRHDGITMVTEIPKEEEGNEPGASDRS